MHRRFCLPVDDDDAGWFLARSKLILQHERRAYDYASQNERFTHRRMPFLFPSQEGD